MFFVRYKSNFLNLKSLSLLCLSFFHFPFVQPLYEINLFLRFNIKIILLMEMFLDIMEEPFSILLHFLHILIYFILRKINRFLILFLISMLMLIFFLFVRNLKVLFAFFWRDLSV